jgi:hypothetical protein
MDFSTSKILQNEVSLKLQVTYKKQNKYKLMTITSTDFKSGRVISL